MEYWCTCIGGYSIQFTLDVNITFDDNSELNMITPL